MYIFAHRMYRLWCDYDNADVHATRVRVPDIPPDPTRPPGIPRPAAEIQRIRRKQVLESATRLAAPFMPCPAIQSANLPADTHGTFDLTTWTIDINRRYWDNADLTYRQFLEASTTLYHELRHAEQVFRIAQGLACRQLTFPAGVGDNLLRHLPRVQRTNAIVARLTMAATRNQPAVITPGLLAGMLNIPLNVANAAVQNAQARFTAYLQLGKPTWFKQLTVLEEVRQWMDLYFRIVGWEMPYGMRAHEVDAHTIHNHVKRSIQNLTGVISDPNAAFALDRDDNQFDHLPTT